MSVAIDYSKLKTEKNEDESDDFLPSGGAPKPSLQEIPEEEKKKINSKVAREMSDKKSHVDISKWLHENINEKKLFSENKETLSSKEKKRHPNSRKEEEKKSIRGEDDNIPTLTPNDYKNKEMYMLKSKWKIIDFLGAGSYGKVFLAQEIKDVTFSSSNIEEEKKEEKTMRLVALKIVDKKNYFPSEVNLWKKISYSDDEKSVGCKIYIVCLYDVIVTSNNVYYVMEHIKGITLRDFMHKTPLQKISFSSTIWIIMKICEAIETMFNLGIVNRDLKPANMLVNYDQKSNYFTTIKIIDLGFSTNKETCLHSVRRDRNGIEMGHIIYQGTPKYSSSVMKSIYEENESKTSRLLTRDEAFSLLLCEDIYLIGKTTKKIIDILMEEKSSLPEEVFMDGEEILHDKEELQDIVNDFIDIYGYDQKMNKIEYLQKVIIKLRKLYNRNKPLVRSPGMNFNTGAPGEVN